MENTKFHNTQEFPLHCPELDDLVKVLQTGVAEHFESVECSIVQCPDLTEAPYNLAKSGLCGNECIADIGGECYLMPLAKKEKAYDLDSISCSVGNAAGLVIGAGGGPSDIGNISEMIINMTAGGQGKLENHIAYFPSTESESYKLQHVTSCESGLLSNVFMCKGDSDKVIKVVARDIRGTPSDSNNFIRALRLALCKHYGDGDEAAPLVALGGVFVMEKGTASIHVMPCYPTPPHGLRCDADVKSWLTFHEVDSPFTSVGYLINRDNGHSLRLEHFHGYNAQGQGGHFHHTTTAQVEYVGYFTAPKKLYRIDEPIRKQKFQDD